MRRYSRQPRRRMHESKFEKEVNDYDDYVRAYLGAFVDLYRPSYEHDETLGDLGISVRDLPKTAIKYATKNVDIFFTLVQKHFPEFYQFLTDLRGVDMKNNYYFADDIGQIMFHLYVEHMGYDAAFNSKEYPKGLSKLIDKNERVFINMEEEVYAEVTFDEDGEPYDVIFP